jgi:hypothetical protein
MSGGNLRAVDRVVKIIRELDRYHGFAAAGLGLDAPNEAAAQSHRPEIPPQGIDNMDSAPGNFQQTEPAAAPAAAAPPSLMLRSDAEGGASRSTLQRTPSPPLPGSSFETPAARAPQDEGVGDGADSDKVAGQQRRPEIRPQRIENMDSAPGNFWHAGLAAALGAAALPPSC